MEHTITPKKKILNNTILMLTTLLIKKYQLLISETTEHFNAFILFQQIHMEHTIYELLIAIATRQNQKLERKEL